MTTDARIFTVALTGASGMPYGVRLIECLLGAGHTVWLLYSQVAQIVARQEMDWQLPSRPADVAADLSARFGAKAGQLRVFGREEWFAPPASGSNPPDAMVVCPCTMGSLAAIANGMSRNLIERAADVVIKERLTLARLGVCILPANPAFYTRPESLQDMVDFVVARVLDQLRVAHQLSPRWGATGEGD